MSHAETLDQLREPTRNLRRASPEVWEEFGHLYRHSMAEGTLSTATKELIALAIAVVEGCDGCIASHARSAVRAGVSPPEVAEALGVSLLMGGGPASINAPRAWEAYCEFFDAARPGLDPSVRPCAEHPKEGGTGRTRA